MFAPTLICYTFQSPVELRHLKYFVAVAEELSFRRAAERLRMAQPPLSAQIKSLEDELGVQLLQRSTRVVKLTAAGEILLAQARSLLAAAEHAQQQTRSAGKGLVGVLRIGVLAPATTSKLAAILRTFRLRFSGVQFLLHELPSLEQIRRLRSDELDVGLLRPPVGFPELETRFFEEAPMVLALPSGHRLAKSRAIKWSDFDGENLVMVHPTLQHGFYDSFFALCAKAGAKPTAGQYANDIHSKLWLISAGFGIAPTVKTVSDVKRPGLDFRPLPEGLPAVQTMLAWKRSNNSPALQNFLRCTQD